MRIVLLELENLPTTTMMIKCSKIMNNALLLILLTTITMMRRCKSTINHLLVSMNLLRTTIMIRSYKKVMNIVLLELKNLRTTTLISTSQQKLPIFATMVIIWRKRIRELNKGYEWKSKLMIKYDYL